jgi:UDP-glucose 4-epimerase
MIERMILMTGGAGFIGSHLTEELLNKGTNVAILDNLNRKMQNVQHLLDNPLVTLIKEYLKERARLALIWLCSLLGVTVECHVAVLLLRGIIGGIIRVYLHLFLGFKVVSNRLKSSESVADGSACGKASGPFCLMGACWVHRLCTYLRT